MKNKKNLLVDDEVIFTKNMSRLLESRGYHVTVVNSGDEAIKALDQDKYDVMVLDMKMPGMDGITTLKEVRKLQLFTETLILTGHGELVEKIEDAKEKNNNSNGKKKSILGALTIGRRKK